MMNLKKLYKFIAPKFQNLFLEYRVNFQPRYGHGKPPHTILYKIINAQREQYSGYLKKALTYAPQIQEIKQAAGDTMLPNWNNLFLPGLDIVGIYIMLAELNPKRYVEVGSGNSTKVAFKSIKENNLSSEIISIDPQPRAEIDQLADQVIREPFENINLELILSLQENDILFIDNSHRILPNSDSMVFFLEVLPFLNKGVVVHIHDVYLPYDYPQFMCDRFYSEQYGLAMYLLANPNRYEPILANYFISEDSELSKLIEPMWDHPNLQGVERHGGSFWMRIVE